MKVKELHIQNPEFISFWGSKTPWDGWAQPQRWVKELSVEQLIHINMSQLSRMLFQARRARRPQGKLRILSPVTLSLFDSQWKEHFYDLFGSVGYGFWWQFIMIFTF